MAKNFGRVNVSITASTGGLTAGLARAGKQLKTFQSSTAALSNVMGMLGGSMGGLLPLFGAFTTAAGAIAALTSATRAAEALHNLSQELGVMPGELQVLQQVANETGVSQELLTTGLRRTSRMVGELAQGTPAAVKAFAQLGLTMEQLAGMSTLQQFQLISQRIAALPPQMQAAAAIDIFGRSGQGLLNFMRNGSESISEMDKLLTALGVKMSTEQVAAIEGMGDAIGRLALPMQGFINQFLAELAPAITAVSNLIVQFFASNNSGWSMATLLAQGFVQALRLIVGAVTLVYGVFQVLSAAIAEIGQMFMNVVGTIVGALATLSGRLASAAKALGFDDLAASLKGASGGLRAFSNASFDEAAVWGDAAASNFAQGVQNMAMPFKGFDEQMQAAKDAAKDTAKITTESAVTATQAAGEEMRQAIKVSTQELKAIVAGTSVGESFRNSILRGADPRLSGTDAAKETANNTERTADAVEDLPDALASAMGGGLGLATISV